MKYLLQWLAQQKDIFRDNILQQHQKVGAVAKNTLHSDAI